MFLLWRTLHYCSFVPDAPLHLIFPSINEISFIIPKSCSTLPKYIYSQGYWRSLFHWALRLLSNKSPFQHSPMRGRFTFLNQSSKWQKIKTLYMHHTRPFPFKMAATGKEFCFDFIQLLHSNWNCIAQMRKKVKIALTSDFWYGRGRFYSDMSIGWEVFFWHLLSLISINALIYVNFRALYMLSQWFCKNGQQMAISNAFKCNIRTLKG